MRLEPPCKVSQDELTLSVKELEPLLQAPAMNLCMFPESIIPINDGQVLYIRELSPEEIPYLMGYLKHYMELDLDFNDLISTRIYSELLGCYRKRLKDPFQFIGLIEGQLAVFGNGRFWSKDVGINLHTMAFVPNHRLIWIMEYIKAFYAFEMMNVKEWWTSVESFNSWRMVGIDMAQPCYHWPEHQHEIGGSPVYYINEKYWNKIIKNYLRAVIGSELIFDIPHEVKTNNKSMRIPLEIDTKSVITKIEPDTGVSKAGISHAA